MAKLDPKFLLRYPNRTTPSEIRLRLNYNYDKFIYPLVDPLTSKVYKILPELWDKKLQKPIPAKKIPYKLKSHTANNTAINTLIDRMILYVSEVLEFARVSEIEITNDFLQEQLDVKIGKRVKKKQVEVTLCGFYEDIIVNMKDGSLLTKGSHYNNDTINSHQRTLLLMREFDLIKRRKTKFDDIDNIWYDNFVQFLTFEYDDAENDFSKEDYTPATIGKHIKNLKMILALAVSKKVSQNREYEQRYFIKPKGNSFAVYLNEDEIKSIYNVKLEGENASLDKYRDLFLIGCYTALRISDYTKIKPENFKETAKKTPVFDIQTIKTKTRVQIPLLYEEMHTIAKKYDYKFPQISTQKLNDAIKIIAEMAGITEVVAYKHTKGGKTIDISEPKCNLVSSHTGRRSAATNLYNIYGLPELSIMQITGHTTSENFRRYIKISGEENADKVAKQVNDKRNGKK